MAKIFRFRFNELRMRLPQHVTVWGSGRCGGGDSFNVVVDVSMVRYSEFRDGEFDSVTGAAGVAVTADVPPRALRYTPRERGALRAATLDPTAPSGDREGVEVKTVGDNRREGMAAVAEALREALSLIARERVAEHWREAYFRCRGASQDSQSDAAATIADLCAGALSTGVRALERSVFVFEKARANHLFMDISIRNMSLSSAFVWHLIADCLLVLGQRHPRLVERVLEVDFSGQQIGNAEASQILLALKQWPCSGKRVVRFVGCSISGFTLSGAAHSLTPAAGFADGQCGIYEVVLNQCLIAHPSATNAVGLLDGVAVLHLAATKIRSMWSLAELIRTLSGSVKHLWLDQKPLVVPDWQTYLVPRGLQRSRISANSRQLWTGSVVADHELPEALKSTMSTNRLTEAMVNASRWLDRSAHLPDERSQTQSVASTPPRARRASRASQLERSNGGLHRLLHCLCADTQNHVVRHLQKTVTAEVSVTELEIFLAGQLPALESLNGHPLGAEARARYHQHFDPWSFSWDGSRDNHMLLRLRERETGDASGFRPRSLLHSGTGERVAPLRLRYERPKARLVFPPAHRPRQFEYHPTVPGRIAVGTLNGTVVATNSNVSGTLLAQVHISGVSSCAQSMLASSASTSYLGETTAYRAAVLGLCWLHRHPEMLLAGADDGALALIRFPEDTCSQAITQTRFPEFGGLTSLHANATDEHFITSGYSIDVALYDIRKQQQIRLFRACHRKHINVVKFSNHSPTVFATCSFDRGVALWDTRQPDCIYRRQMPRGNVMVCFSPDDSKLLVSGEDNQVVQLETSSGRVRNQLPLGHRNCAANYTRSYYMRCFETDYIITGSCEESIVRLFNADTGKQLGDVEMDCIREQLPESPESSWLDRSSLLDEQQAAMVPVHHSYVQSLRPDPHRPFAFSTLLAYYQVDVCSDIMEVDLLS
jgi:hypothetical protein